MHALARGGARTPTYLCQHATHSLEHHLCRAAAHSAASASPGPGVKHQQQQQQQQQNSSSSVRGPPCFTLEASVGAANPLDLQLLSTGAFGAEVHPDLPIATTWYGLYKQLALRLGAGAARQEAAAAAATSIAAAAAAAAAADMSASAAAAAAEASLSAAAGARPVLHVATVGAQLRSLQDTADAMCYAAGVTPTGSRMAEQEHKPHADVLLLVSGSHPVRQLPMASQLLPAGSVKMLQRATQLKQQGVLPAGVELWAVANPVTEADASYTEQKIAAGASVILTQPPLDWPAFERWMDDARRRGLTSAARLCIGFPCLSSAANCGFWLALCNAGNNVEGKRLQQQFAAAEAEAARQQSSSIPGQPRASANAFVQQWNRQLLSRLQATPGVSGLHVMPITATSKRMALQLAKEGAFAPPAWPLATAAGAAAAAAAE